MKAFKISRKTKSTFIENSWSFGGGWNADVTFIDLLFFGAKIKNLHKYYISYRKEFINLKN